MFGHFGQAFGSYYPRPIPDSSISTASSLPPQDAPRNFLSAIAAVSLPERGHSRDDSNMCGVSNHVKKSSSTGGTNLANQDKFLKDLDYYDRMMKEANMLQEDLHGFDVNYHSTPSTSDVPTNNSILSKPNRSPPLVATALQKQLSPSTSPTQSALQIFDASSVHWTSAVVVQVNDTTCDVISHHSSHVATIPFNYIRSIQNTFSINDSIEIFMPIDQQWLPGTIVRKEEMMSTDDNQEYFRVQLSCDDDDDDDDIEDDKEDTFFVPLNLLRRNTNQSPSSFKHYHISIGTQVEVMDTKNLLWKDGYTNVVNESDIEYQQELTPSVMIVTDIRRRNDDDSLINNTFGVPKHFQGIKGIDGRNVFPMPIYFIKDTLKGLHPKRRMRTTVRKGRDQSRISFVDQMMKKATELRQHSVFESVVIDGPLTSHRGGTSVGTGHGDYNRDTTSRFSLTDYTLSMQRLKNRNIFVDNEKTEEEEEEEEEDSMVNGDTKMIEDMQNGNYSEEESVHLNELSRSVNLLYRSKGWISPSERKIVNTNELSIRNNISNKIKQIQDGIRKRKQENLRMKHQTLYNQQDEDRKGIQGRRNDQLHSDEMIQLNNQSHKKWSPSKDWNSSVSIEKKRRPTLRHTVFDEHHSDKHPYQPKPFVPIPNHVYGESQQQQYKKDIEKTLYENTKTWMTSTSSTKREDDVEQNVLNQLGTAGMNVTSIQRLASNAAFVDETHILHNVALPIARRKYPCSKGAIRSPEGDTERSTIAREVERKIARMQKEEKSRKELRKVMSKQERSQRKTPRRYVRESRFPLEKRHV